MTSPAMPDYPAHLAGFHLMTSSTPSNFYAIHWRLLPNLASDLLVPLFALLLPLEWAVKLFLSLALVFWVSGAALIQRSLTGRIGVAPLAGALFAINANFTWGFLNYTFGAGLCFLVFAAWIAKREKLTAWTLAGFTLAVCLLYVCHLFAACILLVLIGGFELTAILRARNFSLPALLPRLACIAAIFVPAALASLFFKSAGGEGGGVEFNYGDTIGDRFGSAAQWAFSQPAYLVIGGLTILIFAGLAYGKVRLHPAMKLLVIGLAILTMIAPEWALGGWGVDMRLPPVLGVITFASLELRAGRRLAAALGALVILVALTNAALLTADWLKHDRQFREFRTAIKVMPLGSKLFTVLDGDALSDISDQPYWHMAEYAIVDREGFTPLMFTTKGQHIVQLKRPFEQIAAATAQQGSPPDATELANLALGREDVDSDIKDVFPYLKYFQCHFDYAVVVHGGGQQADLPAFMQLVHNGSFFSLYKIHPTGMCAPA
ncbi:MAG: hypothetical protein P4L57_00380 [Rhizomicrobium sp.]|nr:hypothetical protein [Rhizomicrobium sp.]